MEKIKNNSGMFYLALLNAVLVLAGMIFSTQSSAGAYKITQLNIIIIGTVATIVLDLAIMVLDKILNNKFIVDLFCWFTIAIVSYMLYLMIETRTTLMGYVIFSNLEANNPVAVKSMNTAMCSWGFFAVALILSVIAGFLKHKNEK